ncbi:SPFH domain-containing protein [Streptomyces sp. NPDC048629]
MPDAAATGFDFEAIFAPSGVTVGRPRSDEADLSEPPVAKDDVVTPRTGKSFDFEALFAPGGSPVSVGAAAEASGTVFGVADVRKAVPKPSGPAPETPKPKPKQKPRPAPTADPALRERPGPVLPGWIGVVAGAVALTGCAAVVWWTGAVPDAVTRMLRLPARPYHGIHLGQWGLLSLGVILALFSLGGLGRGRVGSAWVLTLFGEYRGSVRRTGLLWVSPLLLRRRVDVRLRHWRSEPMPAVDAKGTALNVVVLVVWRIRDTVRAALGVEHHEEYLREQVEAAMARVLSQLPADAFHEDAPTLRDAEAVGEALTKMLSAECAPVGIDVFSAQPTRIEYAPEIAAAMQRRRIAAIDAKHRDSVLTSVVDAVDDMVHRLTTRGLVELDDYERKALVKDLTVAFYTGRGTGGEGA